MQIDGEYFAVKWPCCVRVVHDAAINVLEAQPDACHYAALPLLRAGLDASCPPTRAGPFWGYYVTNQARESERERERAVFFCQKNSPAP
jgi:hypothetical protein